jgi:hypothetical protein
VICLAGSIAEGTAPGVFTVVEALGDGIGPLPSPAQAADQLAAAAVRALDRLVESGLVVQPVD